MDDAYEDQQLERIGEGNRRRCDDKAGRSNQREATSANAVGYPTGGNREDHDREAVGAENETCLAICKTKFVVPDRNQRDRR